MRKGDIIENLVVETMASEGKCVSRVDGKVIFLQGGAPGDTVDARVTKIKSSFLEGTVTAIKKFSADRVVAAPGNILITQRNCCTSKNR
jgi:23S rRNA (uracil1939-C5)-methyltransferase